MELLNKSFVENKKSKFYGYLYSITSEDEVNIILNDLKKGNKKAKHFVYAYRINNIERKNEDKEPSGTAGMPLLDILKIKELNNTLIVVVRYFGGTLLGRGLLTRSYREAASKLFE